MVIKCLQTHPCAPLSLSLSFSLSLWISSPLLEFDTPLVDVELSREFTLKTCVRTGMPLPSEVMFSLFYLKEVSPVRPHRLRQSEHWTNWGVTRSIRLWVNVTEEKSDDLVRVCIWFLRPPGGAVSSNYKVKLGVKKKRRPPLSPPLREKTLLQRKPSCLHIWWWNSYLPLVVMMILWTNLPISYSLLNFVQPQYNPFPFLIELSHLHT